jgi:hypothetical protein
MQQHLAWEVQKIIHTLVKVLKDNDATSEPYADPTPAAFTSDTNLATKFRQAAKFVGFDSDSFSILMDSGTSQFITP